MHQHDMPDRVRVRGARNPFGVMDVPGAEANEVTAFAATVTLDGAAEDDNASPWGSAGDLGPSTSDLGPSNGIEGLWSSRWNGGADPTIPGDATHLWKQGDAELKTAGDLVYLLFDWANGARWGLIHARREGDGRLILHREHFGVLGRPFPVVPQPKAQIVGGISLYFDEVQIIAVAICKAPRHVAVAADHDERLSR